MAIRSQASRSIGPWGSGARAVVGIGMIVGAVAIGIRAVDALLGLLVVPIAISAAVGLRGRRTAPIRLTGPGGHCLNCALIVGAFVVVPVAALLFYGTSMLVSAARGYGGCELLAMSNWLWHRDDQIACPLFHPIDVAEARSRGHGVFDERRARPSFPPRVES